MDKKKEQTFRETDNEQKPVYTGDYLRDSAVSVYRRASHQASSGKERGANADFQAQDQIFDPNDTSASRNGRNSCGA